MKRTRSEFLKTELRKSPTGIGGLDEITGGGLPTGRPTLICGDAGCGKTLLAIEFLVHGAVQYHEPGVLVAFEETREDLAKNVASLGFDLKGLAARKLLLIDHVRVERSEIEETGEYDLEGLFIRLGHAIDAIGAKRVVLDTLEALFAGLPNPAILRAELRRLFRWLKERGMTAIITGERGEKSLTRHGLEEYVSDCVITLDHRVVNQMSTRRLRVVKYRGSTHGTNEYPFLIDEHGISVWPVTSVGLTHEASRERISTGIARLDTMLGGEGYFRGSTILLSGTAGSGKTSVAAHFADAVCRRGERCLFFAFEESPSQIMANMRSIGLNLQPWVTKGLLQFRAARPTTHGLEMHLATMFKAVSEFQPAATVVDQLGCLSAAGESTDVKAVLTRLVDYLKMKKTTALMTDLTGGGSPLEHTNVAVSSLIDTWLLLRDTELNGERNRLLHVLKSRGMAHSNQVREFLLTGHGVELADVYAGPAGVLTGSARAAQEAREQAEQLAASQEIERQKLALERKRGAVESQIAAMRAEFAAAEIEAQGLICQEQDRKAHLAQDGLDMARRRQANGGKAANQQLRRATRRKPDESES